MVITVKRNLFFLLIGVIFVGAGFLTGYFAGSWFYEGEPLPTPTAMQDTVTAHAEKTDETASQEAEDEPEPTYAGIQYLVALEGENLCLYEVDGEQKKRLRKNPIETALYPESDIRELTAGIYAGTLESALEILESFAG